MGWIRKTALGTAGLIGLGAFGGYLWFWGAPVGVNNYINKASLQMVADSPEMLSYMGMIDNTVLDFHSDKLGSYTKEQDEISLEKLKEARAGMDKYGPDGLEGQELLSWKITAWFFDDLIAGEEFEYSGYPMSQLSGPMVDMPQFLTDTHVIKSKRSAERYVSRVAEFGRVIGEMEVRVREYADNGVIAPDFVLEKSITGMRSFIDGGASENPLVTTLPARLKKVDGLSDDFKNQMIAEVKALVESDIIPGYESMIALHEDLLKSATHDAGIWRIPNGEKIYKTALRSNTTTDMTADEIHNIGLSEVARIEKEMDAILQGEGLTDGPLSERVAAMMSRADQIYPDNDAGRAAMIAELERLNEEVMAKAGDYFVTLPPQPLEIKRIPEYSQDGAPGGYYSGPALDGSRPGQFYINLKDPVDNPKWTLPTLLYHEAAPGHHFQISRSQMIEDVPILRKMSPFTAYTEGWALYAEYLAANDMGMYDDNPLGDLGRLQAEMFRAVRLVVDTGLHHKRWTREEAIDYMAEKTGNSAGDVEREIERYAVWPGQATAYKTGQLAILRLRKHAEDELGEDFNLRDFNELILANGAMPLGILDEVVKAWVVDEKQK
ncbi:hypothetical protein GCM10011309_09420 [Litorimonas cladophorae]|uniref:DUF885 domain-containing protein n=1 Tax=Litorimonas cladophorae TaxID=1220491 RepID=A0A918KFH6_9PROT|nr:DUF885 domain-containing protein [Litorimonas cladophorae]GGX61586.1 hypothetical protein GCM10011309_09420 [Litorimonas cladophorae]